jgi:hypothetical protein
VAISPDPHRLSSGSQEEKKIKEKAKVAGSDNRLFHFRPGVGYSVPAGPGIRRILHMLVNSGDPSPPGNTGDNGIQIPHLRFRFKAAVEP